MMRSEYVVLWAFDIGPGTEADFLRHYGPGGTWTKLFKRGAGYLGTALLADRERPGRYVTVDRWTTADAYKAFRERFSAEYETLDKECVPLSVNEESLGSYRETGKRS